ncbi:MAG: substrate-binding domain-containing protein [Spirochaetales bacterium]|nr:substrate-binding domain-containing protein [Spirochaetales bacterium]
MKSKNLYSDADKIKGRERTIALLGRDLHFEIPVNIFRVTKELARRKNCNLLYFTGETYKSPFSFDVQANILYNLISRHTVDGAIVISNLLSSPTSSRAFQERCLQFHPLPVVSLGIVFDKIPSVVPDNTAGMYDAVCHLIEVHHLTRIAFLSGPQGHPDVEERFAAFSRAMETHGLPIDESLLLRGNFQKVSGTAAVRELLDVRGKIPGRHVEAIVCCNDYMASGAMVELQGRGIQIPGEIALVGFDDIPFTSCLNPGLSTIHQPFDIIASKATEMLFRMIDGKTVPESVQVSARFIPRGSCGCPDTQENAGDPPLPKDLEKLLKTPGKFSAYLNRQIIDAIKPTLSLWKHALSHLYRDDKWSHLSESEDSSSNYSQTAWRLLGNLAFKTFHRDNYQNMIYNIGSALSSTLDLSELMDILLRMLPEAGIKRCCICLYENPENTPALLPAWSRLILAFSQSGPEKLPSGGMRFATCELLPKEIIRKQGWNSWVILALYFREEQIGYMLMDSDAPYENIHWNLRNQISSALKGARLLDETRKANEFFVQVNEQKTQFFINVAHETRTPLTLIQNYLALYMKQYQPDKKLLVIKENIDLLLGHMLNFLDVEQLQKGEMIYHHDTFVDVSESARKKCSLFQPLASIKKIRIKIEVEDHVIVKIDPQALDRIFNNLLDNAVKYIQDGGIIAINVRRDNGKALLSIKDNGPGLPSDINEHIFQPYFLLSKRKSGHQGIGVGLSIVKKIIDGLGAVITVENGKENGACFTIAFTDSSSEAGDQRIQEISATAPSTSFVQKSIKEKNITDDKHSLLVVDDNIQLLKFVQTAFFESYNVFLARNTAEALIKLKIIPRPDLIISDIMMDGADGFQLLSALSTKEGYNDIPFIFLTALSGEKEKLKGLDLGAVDYIEKPFSIDTLRAKIESIIALRSRQEKQDLERIRSRIDGLLSGSGKNSTDSALSGFGRTCEKYGILDREREIIRMLMNGLVNKEIASCIHLSQRAVEYHISKIYKKCGVNSKYELLNKFISLDP